MKRSDIYVLCLLVLIVGFSFLGIKNNVVIGQATSSSSSSSSGDASISSSSSSGIVVSTSSSGSSSIVLNKNFTGHWKAKIEKPCVVCTQEVPSCSSGQVVALSSCMECAHCVNATVSGSSSGSVVSREFLAHLASDVPGSRVLTFKLCVNKDGKLEGDVQQGGALIGGMITTQNVISADEVEFNVESRDGKTAHIKLKLTGERQFIGTFADGHEFEGRKLNPNRPCLAGIGPTTSGGVGGPGGEMGGPGMGGSGMGGPGLNGSGGPTDFGTGGSSGNIGGPGGEIGGPGMGEHGKPGGNMDGPGFNGSGGPDMSGFPGMGDFPG